MDAFIQFWNDLPPRQLYWARVVLAALLVVMALFGTRLFHALFAWLERKLKRILPQWLHILIDGFDAPVVLLVRAVLLYGALLTFPVPLIETVTLWKLLTPFVSSAAVLLIAWGFWRSAPLCRLLLRSAENKLDLETNQTLGNFFENIYRFIVGVFAVLIVLDAFGVPVASLVAGAGIIGLAVSLAAQSTLSNLIAGITLVLEHPFGIGDYIMLGSFEGTVEDISFRSTRIRTPDQVLISVENSKVCSEYIQNGSVRNSRLLTYTLRLANDIPCDELDALRDEVAALFRADKGIRPENVIITVDTIGDDGIKMLIRCWTSTGDYNEYLYTRDRLNRATLRLLEAHGCSLAYPPVSVKTL